MSRVRISSSAPSRPTERSSGERRANAAQSRVTGDGRRDSSARRSEATAGDEVIQARRPAPAHPSHLLRATRARPATLTLPVTIVDSGVEVTPEVSEVFPMSRPRWICLGALVLVLALLPFVPRGGAVTTAPIRRGPPGPDRHAPLIAGYGRVTPAFQREIDRVVDGRYGAARSRARTRRPRPRRELVRCADFEGQRYCLGIGLDRPTRRHRCSAPHGGAVGGPPDRGRPTAAPPPATSRRSPPCARPPG